VEASRFDEGTAYVTLDRHTFGDLVPYVFKTTDFGKTWTRIAGPQQGLRGYAHVVKEDVRKKDLLFVGTEYGLWISIDGGKRWAEFKGGNFPSVAVRDLVVHERENDVVLATHGRGIWIIDDLTPLRELSDGLLEKDAAFLSARPVQQRFVAGGGSPEGDASFAGENPPGGAVITYYQKTRHLYGPIKLEILDSEGKVIDTIPASKRRGINRVSWSMRVAPPRAPKAAQLAGSATQGPRVLPGTYTVRLTKGDKVYESKLDIGLDRRAAYTLEERKAQFDAAMRVHAMFGQMTDLTEHLQFVRTSAGQLAEKLPAKEALRRKLEAIEARGDELRKQIVATTEGGAITGEERLREHTGVLYGAILSYEGRPANYQLERIDVLQRELDEVTKAFASLTAQLPELNASLKAKGLPEMGSPPVVAPAAQLSSGDVENAFGRFLGLPVHEQVRFEERD
jgi:hypothetical protein